VESGANLDARELEGRGRTALPWPSHLWGSGWWVGFGRAKSGLKGLPSGVTQHSGRSHRLHRKGPQPGRNRVGVLKA